MVDSDKSSLNIAFVCPDGLSIVLFCKGIIRTLKSIPRVRVLVICDAGNYFRDITSLGVQCVSVPMYRWFNPLEDIKYSWRLWRTMRRYKCEIILNFTTKPNIYGTFVGKFAGVKFNYLHVVGLGSGFEQRTDIRSKIMRWSFECLYRFACRWSHKVWFTNSRDRQFFIDHGLISEKNTVLSRNYIDTNEYAIDLVSEQRKEEARAICGLSNGEKMVIMVARMIWQKGIREFAEAAELLCESYPKLKFILIAPLEKGSQDVVPESFIREKERSANLKWLGFQDDVKQFYAIADLAVLPTYYKEGGYPRALLEPMSMGKPVITTNSEDCRGAVEDGQNGFLVPIKDSKALAEAIVRVISNNDLREAFGNYSRIKAIRDFDERSIVPDALRKLCLPIPELIMK
ncbi:MAG: glycosyltransferase family 4 protein [Desulfobacterales bacterium]|nr:glycosyltransferase family 4 protein [Desulfobacterales bacterium]